MAVNSIFGINVDLPSIPGIQSTCEVELLQLMKEIDLVVERKNQEWQKQLEEAQILYAGQDKEIQQLRNSLKAMSHKYEILEKKIEKERKNHNEQVEQYVEQIRILNQEVTDLRKTNSLLSQQEENERDKILHKSRAADKLMEEVKQLKGQVWKKDQQQKYLEASYQKLLNIISGLQRELKDKENKQKNCLPDVSTIEQHLVNATETFLKEEETDRKELQFKISQEIVFLEEKLKSSVLFL